YDRTGALQWAKKLDPGAAGESAAAAIAYDPAGGSVVVTGYFTGTAAFQGTGPSVTSAGGRDIFVLRLDGTGAATSLLRFGAAGTDEGLGVAVGSGSSVYVTGDFAGTVDFNPVAVTPGDTLTSAGAGDAFVLQLDASGNFVRVGRLGGTGADTGLGVAVDGSGNVALTGSFTGTTSGLAVLAADTDAGPSFT